jgi:hypothetical protein
MHLIEAVEALKAKCGVPASAGRGRAGVRVGRGPLTAPTHPHSVTPTHVPFLPPSQATIREIIGADKEGAYMGALESMAEMAFDDQVWWWW